VKNLLAVALCLLAGLSAAAESPSGAEAAVLRYAEVTRKYDTAAMAALIHPEALKRFRITMDSALAGPKGEQAERELLPLFAVTTRTAYSALSDVEAYKRLNDTVAKSAPGLIGMMATSVYEIVGSTIKDGIAYVTYNLKMTVEGAPVSSHVVQTLKSHNGQWLLLLPSTADATIAGIEARFK
jgi:hypothetical protein